MHWMMLFVALITFLLVAPPVPAVAAGASAAPGKTAGAKSDDGKAAESGARGAPKTSPVAPAKPAKVSVPATTGESVNVNTADVKKLMTLDGVGRRVAERIVEYRRTHGPFKKPEELRRVEGIGAGLFARNRERIVVR